jgi:hypothetical protein
MLRHNVFRSCNTVSVENHGSIMKSCKVASLAWLRWEWSGGERERETTGHG